MSDNEWEQIKKKLSELKEQKEVNPEKNKDPFRTKDKLKRTISGFAPNHQLERTQSEGFQAERIPGFFPTKELDRTNPKLSQDEATTSQLTEIDNISQLENTTDSSLSSNDESVTTEKKFEKKGKKLPKKIRKLTKREKLDVQIEHDFNDKSLTEKRSQRIVYLEKPTPKKPDNVFEYNPGVKLKINEGDSSHLNKEFYLKF
jgi:hypothetical protein